MTRLSFARIGLAACTGLVVAACGGGGGGANSGPMDIVVASNGFPGQLLPYQINVLGTTGAPTTQVIEIRTLEQLSANVNRANADANPVHAVPSWPTTAVLPSGAPGNHFVFVQFTRPIQQNSVLDLTSTGAVNFGLTGAITVTSLDPTTGVVTPVPGRPFIDGFTPDPASPGSLVRWVGASSSGQPVALQPQGAGFPGVASTFPDAARLVLPQTFVFIPDTDGDLSTFETFPLNRQIQVKCSVGVKAKGGDFLSIEAHASSTVGIDTVLPEVLRNPTTLVPAIFVEENGQMVLAAGQTDVSPLTPIEIEFTEPVQPGRVGQLPSSFPPGLSPSTSVTFGPAANPIPVTFTAEPVSPYNLSRYRLTPSFNFPGSDPVVGPGPFNTINTSVGTGTVADFRYNFFVNPPSPINLNASSAGASFEVGEGPGLVNSVVSPDAVYIGRNGANGGISVIDLNGFGQTTGNPTQDSPLTPQIEWFWNQVSPTAPAGVPLTKFIYNPNLQWGLLLEPDITEGTTTLDGGSGGLFSLVRDSALSDRLVRAPLIQSIADMAIGHSLDRVFNNSDTFCQFGGGNQCARDSTRSAGNGLFQNTIQFAPEPNPPGFLIPSGQPLCISPLLLGREVTSTVQPPGVTNVLGQGDPFGNPVPGFGVGTPPTGVYHITNNGSPNFLGPAPPPQGDPTTCVPYILRQQVGHFLYVIDPVQDKVIVLNSNRMTMVDSISLPDPTRFAVEPNLRRIAVSNFATGTVSLVDIDPTSNTFHQVVATVPVGNGPLGVAWQPENEDLFVCNSVGNSVSVISGASLAVRKILTNQVQQPVDVAVTPRQTNFGFQAGVYFAYILNQTGTVAVFESGPSGSNGIGFDEIIGSSSSTGSVFPSPQAIQPDVSDFNSGAWIAHRDANGLPTLSHFHLNSSPAGPQPLVNFAGVILIPSFRERNWLVDRVIGPNQLSGIPTDIAFDNAVNVAATPMYTSGQVPTPGVTQDSKGLVRFTPAPTPTYFPNYMFVSCPSAGVVDVVDPTSLLRIDVDPVTPGVQSIPAPGAAVLCDYWRQ